MTTSNGNTHISIPLSRDYPNFYYRHVLSKLGFDLATIKSDGQLYFIDMPNKENLKLSRDQSISGTMNYYFIYYKDKLMIEVRHLNELDQVFIFFQFRVKTIKQLFEIDPVVDAYFDKKKHPNNACFDFTSFLSREFYVSKNIETRYSFTINKVNISAFTLAEFAIAIYQNNLEKIAQIFSRLDDKQKNRLLQLPIDYSSMFTVSAVFADDRLVKCDHFQARHWASYFEYKYIEAYFKAEKSKLTQPKRLTQLAVNVISKNRDTLFKNFNKLSSETRLCFPEFEPDYKQKFKNNINSVLSVTLFVPTPNEQFYLDSLYDAMKAEHPYKAIEEAIEKFNRADCTLFTGSFKKYMKSVEKELVPIMDQYRLDEDECRMHRGYALTL